MALTGYEKSLSEFTRDELRTIASTYGISLRRIIEERVNKSQLINLIEKNELYKKANPKKNIQSQQTYNRIEKIKTEIRRLQDPEDMMIRILEELKDVEMIPEVGKFYTFVYNAKTPNLEYDQHPLIACTEIKLWGFRGINFHWQKYRNYTWNEVAGQLHIVRYNELDDLLSIPYAKYLKTGPK
jgi:hypothetical protein